MQKEVSTTSFLERSTSKAMSFSGLHPSAFMHWRMPQEELENQTRQAKLIVSPQVETVTQGSSSGATQTGQDGTFAVRFNCKGWKSKALQVFDDKSDAIAYTIDTKFRKPNLIYKHGEDGQTFGSASFHSLSTKIETEINGKSTEMKLAKILGSTYTYSSPSFNNSTMTWKSGSGWKNLDYVLLDEQSLPVAKCSAPYFSKDFSGRLEFIESKVTSQQAKEEILVTAFALIYMTITAYYAAI